MRRSRRLSLARALPLLLLAVSCATRPPPPPVPTARTVPGSPAEVRARVEAAARRLGLDVSPEPSGLRAESRSAQAEWAGCDPILVYDRDSETQRSGWASPGARSATVNVSLAPAAPAGTQVTVAARFAATYTNRYVNLPVIAGCDSAGVIERALLDAAGGGL